MSSMESSIGMLPPSPRTDERDALEAKYTALVNEQLEFSKLVTYVPNKTQPIYRWFRYKEGFSSRLVEELVCCQWLLPQGSLIFDPFAGCGTTLLACQDLGYLALGCDIMPIAVFVTKVKLLHSEYDLKALEDGIDRLLAREYQPTGAAWPKVRIVDLAFTKETQDKILFYRHHIQNVAEPSVRDFLMMGLLCSLEPASYTSKDGQFLRLIKREPKPIEVALTHALHAMLTDLHTVRSNGAPAGLGRSKAQMFHGDARSLPRQLGPYAGRIAAIITSPPYLNRYDYSRTYALELCLLYDEHGSPCVQDFGDLKDIRHSLLRSHIESRPAPTDAVRIPALDEILQNLESKHLNNPRIPIMIKGYFEDMNLVLGEMARMLMPGGLVALVVANARFEGELVPVDLILSEIAA